jgi:peptide/nickel transport system permease protein
MVRFIIRRILTGIPVVFGVIALVFVLARVIPGDPCRAALQEKANAATCQAFNQRFGLTEPIPVQFAIYLRDIATGNLGESIKTGQPVT